MYKHQLASYILKGHMLDFLLPLTAPSSSCAIKNL